MIARRSRACRRCHGLSAFVCATLAAAGLGACARDHRPAPAPAAAAMLGASVAADPVERPVELAAESAAPPAAAPAEQVDGEMLRGQQVYGKYCAVCHGEQGDGAGKFAHVMNPRPRNFLVGDFKLSTTVNRIPSDADLLRTISKGMPGSAMPPWGHLPDPDLQALVRVVRAFHAEGTESLLREWVSRGTLRESEVQERLAERVTPGPALTVPPEPPFDDVRRFRGQRLYLEGCAICHGADGQPVSGMVKFDPEGYPVPPRSFVSGVFKGGNEGHQLYARILKGVRGTPMPASEGVYSADELWDLVHYVQSFARPGAQERAQLQQGTLTAPNIRGPLPEGPLDPAWEQARALYVGLTPLWWTENRVEGLVVQALHDGEEIAMRLAWIDPTKDDSAVRQREFRDAVAVQFSLSSDPPFYMGSAGDEGGVNIWMWKADRQRNLADGYHDVDDAFPDRIVDGYPEQAEPRNVADGVDWVKAPLEAHDPLFISAWGAGNIVADPRMPTSVECLVARGPGTLAGKPIEAQIVQGAAVYERGVWYVQIRRRMQFLSGDDHHCVNDERAFRPGDYLPVSFAIWNGSAGDRDGKKNISIWQKLVIE